MEQISKDNFIEDHSIIREMYKNVFNFERLDSVHAMFQELGLPTFNTLMHNAKHKFSMNSCTNRLVYL